MISARMVALYRKAGLSGRHDLAAFFIEDLLSPREAASARGNVGTPREA